MKDQDLHSVSPSIQLTIPLIILLITFPVVGK